MRIRVLALALPLAAGIACSTSKTQGSRTASTDSGPDASASAQARAGGAGVSTGNASGATASGRATTPDAGMRASGDVKAHSDDEVVTGKISEVSPQSLTIRSSDGATKTLQLVPQTSVQVDGRDAQNADLQEGLPVRASFNTVGGDDVAVTVHAGQGATDTGRSGSADTGLTPGSDMGGTNADSGGGKQSSAPESSSPQNQDERK